MKILVIISFSVIVAVIMLPVGQQPMSPVPQPTATATPTVTSTATTTHAATPDQNDWPPIIIPPPMPPERG